MVKEAAVLGIPVAQKLTEVPRPAGRRTVSPIFLPGPVIHIVDDRARSGFRPAQDSPSFLSS
ncbi:hypothetical protein SAMN05421595_2438 [Austwickia chelonae]|nr:hypothetical protein SAMN05421595_2438 [Austwickia chelonae]